MIADRRRPLGLHAGGRSLTRCAVACRRGCTACRGQSSVSVWDLQPRSADEAALRWDSARFQGAASGGAGHGDAGHIWRECLREWRSEKRAQQAARSHTPPLPEYESRSDPAESEGHVKDHCKRRVQARDIFGDDCTDPSELFDSEAEDLDPIEHGSDAEELEATTEDLDAIEHGSDAEVHVLEATTTAAQVFYVSD